MTNINIFDVLSKIQFERNPRQLINLTNKLFSKDYDLNSKVIFKNTESIDLKSLKTLKGDIFYQIEEGLYHIEIQSSKDKNISKRMGNYSLRFSEIKGIDEVSYDYYIPRQYIIAQREKWKLEHINVRMFFGDDLVHSSKIPIINTSELTKECIEENPEYIILYPFKIFSVKDNKKLDEEIERQIKFYNELLKKGQISEIEKDFMINLLMKYKEFGGEKMAVKEFKLTDEEVKYILESDQLARKWYEKNLESSQLLRELNEERQQTKNLLEKKDATIKRLLAKIKELENKDK